MLTAREAQFDLLMRAGWSWKAFLEEDLSITYSSLSYLIN